RRSKACPRGCGSLRCPARCAAVILVADEVREADAVVGLETTLIAHGFPAGEGVAVGLESERRIREAGAVPAPIGVLQGPSRGVPVLGFRTDDLPLFYSAHGGPPVPARVESAAEAAEIAAAHWELGGGGLLLARPPDTSLEDVEPLLEEALAAARRRNVKGQAV